MPIHLILEGTEHEADQLQFLITTSKLVVVKLVHVSKVKE